MYPQIFLKFELTLANTDDELIWDVPLESFHSIFHMYLDS